MKIVLVMTWGITKIRRYSEMIYLLADISDMNGNSAQMPAEE